MWKEYSKQLVFWVLIFCGFATIAVFIGWYLGKEHAVEMLIPIVSIASVVIIYYANKARAENIEKIKKNGILSKEEIALIIQIKENYGSNLMEGLTKIATTQELVG